MTIALEHSAQPTLGKVEVIMDILTTLYSLLEIEIISVFINVLRK
jgi:hypothetical protein